MGRLADPRTWGRGLPTPVRGAGFVSLAWGSALLVWAAYLTVAHTGLAVLAQGLFFYGGHSSDADTGDLSYGLFYVAAAVLIFTGRGWVRGAVLGVAVLDGYNRLRSLSGALFGAGQLRYFTSGAEPAFLFVRSQVGLLASVVLILLLARHLGGMARDDAGEREEIAPPWWATTAPAEQRPTRMYPPPQHSPWRDSEPSPG